MYILSFNIVAYLIAIGYLCLFLFYRICGLRTITISQTPPKHSKRFLRLHDKTTVYLDLNRCKMGDNQYKYTILLLAKLVNACIDNKNVYIYGDIKHSLETAVLQDIASAYKYRLRMV